MNGESWPAFWSNGVAPGFTWPSFTTPSPRFPSRTSPPRDRLTVASLSLLYALELAARGYLQAEDLFSLLKTSPETRERWES